MPRSERSHADAEMAERIRAHDWAGTSLGPMEAWPPSLITVVDLMLATAQLATLAVGPERIFLYNDESSRHYGSRHPKILGQPLANAFAHEFANVAPFYDRVFAGESLHVSNQSLDPALTGQPEVFDAYLTPVRDRDGRVVAAYMTGLAVGGQQRAEATLRESEAKQAFLLRLADDLRARSDVVEIQAAASRLLAEQLGADRAFYCEIEDAPGARVALVRGQYAGVSEPFPDRLDYDAFGLDWTSKVLSRGEPVVIADLDQDPRSTEHTRAAWRALGIDALIIVARVEHGREFVNCGVFQNSRRQWSSAEVDLVRDAAERTWAAAERARAEAALRESEERLRQFGDASQDILWSRDAATLQWQYLTPAFETIYGLKREEALSGNNYRGWLELIVPEDRKLATAMISRVRAGEHVTFDYRIRRPLDGAIRWMRNTDFPITDANGKVVLIGGIGHDMTELRKTELRFQTLVEGIAQLVWRAVGGGEWTWASPQWTDYTGQSEPESRGWGWLEALHPEDRGAAHEAWSDAAERGGFQVEYCLRRNADGAYRWFQTRATPVRNEGGEIVEWLGASTDIHDLRIAEQRQKVLLAELQHRVRNILGVIRSVVGRTAQTSHSVEDFAAHFEGRLNAMARTQVILTRALGAAVDLELLVRDELHAQVADERRISIEGPEVRLSAKAAEILTLAIHELATNAVKYGALGADTGRVDVRWTTDQRPSGFWLRLEWVESGVKVASLAPRREGFGSELIKTRVPYELKGNGQLRLRPGGVACIIEFPLRAGESILQTDAATVTPLRGAPRT